MKKFIALVLVCLLLTVYFGGCSSDDKVETGLYTMEKEDSYKLSVAVLGEDVMPVAVYVSPTPEHSEGFNREPSLINDKYYALLKDTGVNVVFGHDENGEDITKNLDLCQKYGMAYFLYTNNEFENMGFWKDTAEGIVCYPDYSEEEQNTVKQKFLAMIDQYVDHPAFAGIKFSDEVGVDLFPALKAATEIFYENYPNKIIYHNLLGNQASKAMMQYAPLYEKYTDVDNENIMKNGYRSYVTDFVENVPVKYVSYDNYPILTIGLNPQWMYNMSTVINIANNHGVAFWNFIQADKYDETSAVPNEAQMLWQVNTSLAYGAKGMEIFTFFCPISFIPYEKNGIVVNCIDRNGEVNQLYYSTKTALSQVSMMDEVLMNSRWKGLMVSSSGFPATEVVQTDILTSFNHLDNIVSTNSHVIVGCFNYQGKTVLLVVNNSVISPTNVILNFNVGTKGYYIKDSTKFDFTSKNKQLIIPYLVAGGSALVVID